MQIRTHSHPRIPTRAVDGSVNGYLVPLYNIHDGVFAEGDEPKQVYLTVIAPGQRKGPHLHHVRTGFFTCIKGHIKVVLKTAEGYQEFCSGDSEGYLSVSYTHLTLPTIYSV